MDQNANSLPSSSERMKALSWHVRLKCLLHTEVELSSLLIFRQITGNGNTRERTRGSCFKCVPNVGDTNHACQQGILKPSACAFEVNTLSGCDIHSETTVHEFTAHGPCPEEDSTSLLLQKQIEDAHLPLLLQLCHSVTLFAAL